MNPKIIELVKEYIIENYSHQYATLITGSYAEGKETIYSDVDVIIFTTERIQKIIKTLNYKGITLQLIIFSVESIEYTLYEDFLSNKGVYIDMISKGFILLDPHHFLKHLKEYTTALKENGSTPLSKDEDEKYRSKITSYLLDIEGVKDIKRIFFVALLLIDVLAEFKLRLLRQWGGTGKTKSEFLRKVAPTFFEELQIATQMFFEKGDKDKLITITKELLDSTGGKFIQELNFQKFAFSEKMLVIQVSKVLHQKECAEIILAIVPFLKTHSINAYHFISSTDGFLYLIIEDFNKSQLQKLLNKFPDEQLIDIHYFYPQTCFNSLENYQKLLPFFEILSKEAFHNLENENFKILKGLNLLITLRKIEKMSKEEYLSFLKYLIDCWIMYCVDDILINKAPETTIEKSTILKKYNSIFQKQKQYLKSTLKIDKSYHILSEALARIDNRVIPLYKTFLITPNFDETKKKKFCFCKNVLDYCYSILFIEPKFKAYLPYVALQIE